MRKVVFDGCVDSDEGNSVLTSTILNGNNNNNNDDDDDDDDDTRYM